ACAEAGATVVLLGRRLPRLNRVYDAVAAAGAEPLLYPLDLEGASPDDYAELATRIEAELGRLDGILHCAAEFRGLTPPEHQDPATSAGCPRGRTRFPLRPPARSTSTGPRPGGCCRPAWRCCGRRTLRRWCWRWTTWPGWGRPTGAAAASPSTAGMPWCGCSP